MASLERTLGALADVYEAGTLEQKQRCRGEVIEARQHALWAQARLQGDERREREAMRETMLVWLEIPACSAHGPRPAAVYALLQLQTLHLNDFTIQGPRGARLQVLVLARRLQ